MSNFTDLQQAIEAVNQKLSELNDQNSKSDEYMLCLTNEVEDRVRQNQAEMMQNRTEYERIMREYGEATRLLHSLELMTLNASSRSYPTSIFRDLDSNTKALAPGSAANGNGELADPGAVVDPNHLRRGLQRMFKNKGNSVPKGAEAEESAT